MQGTIKFFNETKAFGFITPAEGGDDIFVHISGITKVDPTDAHSEATFMPKENDKVSYDVEQGRKGLQAANVSLIESAA